MIKDQCKCDCDVENDILIDDEFYENMLYDTKMSNNSNNSEFSSPRSIYFPGCVKYCKETNRFCIPFKPDTFTTFLKKAEVNLRKKA